MQATVPRSDIGMAMITFSVAPNDPRKSQQMKAVRITDSSSSNWISRTDSSMNCVESKLMPSSIPAGRVFWISAMASFTPRATATALEPRCLRMPMPWAGSPLTRETRRTSSKPSSTMATSLR
jgi:hypothetical protein